MFDDQFPVLVDNPINPCGIVIVDCREYISKITTAYSPKFSGKSAVSRDMMIAIASSTTATGETTSTLSKRGCPVIFSNYYPMTDLEVLCMSHCAVAMDRG